MKGRGEAEGDGGDASGDVAPGDGLGAMIEPERAAERRPELAREAKATVSGTIRSRGRGPLAGARVCAWPGPHELRGLGEPAPKCTLSGRDGRYRLEGLWPVATRIEASAAEHVPGEWRRPDGQGLDRMRVTLMLRAADVREGIDIELQPGGTKLGGVVKDIAGGVIEGALVVSRNGRWTSVDSARAIARTDESGRFELWTQPGPLALSAYAEGYAASGTDVFSPSGSVEIFLTPESVLVGRVVHAQTGEPLADIPVVADGGRFDQSFGDPSARSDAEGNFRIGRLAPGVYKPVLRTDNFYGQAATQVHLGLGQTSEPVEVRAHPVAYVEGRIVEAGTELGCREGSVEIDAVGHDERRTIHSDDEGWIRIPGVLPGEYEIKVACVGMVAEPEYPNLVVAADDIGGLVWTVREGLAIRGVVVDGEGRPVSDVEVSARMRIDPGKARAQTTGASSSASEADGRFEVAGLLPGTYELSAWTDRPRLTEPVEVELSPGADRNDVRIELPATGSVKGRVIDEQGVGQANVQVVAGPLGEWKESQTRTDEQGNFVIEHVRAGEVRVMVTADRWNQGMRKPGSSDDDEQGEIVTLAANEIAELELVVESRSGVIRGTVLDEGGAPVDDAFVTAQRMPEGAGMGASVGRFMARSSWSGHQPRLSEADGSFVLEGLAPGKYIVRAQRKGGGEALAEGVELGSDIELTITATGMLAGVVKLEGGEPPETFAISIRDPKAGLSFSDSYFRTAGRWELRELPAGNYELMAKSALGDGKLSVELGEGESVRDLEVVLQPRVTIKGRLVDADSNAPIAGMKVQVDARGSSWSISMDARKAGKEVSDEQGYFEVDKVPAGKVYLRIMPRVFNANTGYGLTTLGRILAAEPAVQDLGDIPLIAKRIGPEETAGDLGYEVKSGEPGREPEDSRIEIALVRPGGPAAAAGLAVGDVIESVDGRSVTGVEVAYYNTLVNVPAGRVLELGLAGGKTVRLTVGPPRD